MDTFQTVYDTGVVGNTYTVSDGTSKPSGSMNTRTYQEWLGRNFSGVLVAKIAGPPRQLQVTLTDYAVTVTITEPSGLTADNTAQSAPRQTLSTYAAIVQCNSSGAPKAGQVPVVIQGRRYKGTTEVTGKASWNIVGNLGSWSSSGSTFSLSTFPSNPLTVFISSTLDGVTLTDSVTISTMKDATDTSSIGTGVSSFQDSGSSVVFGGATSSSVMLTSGTSWTVPAGVTSVVAECWGGGGSGGGSGVYSGGGGGGAYAAKTITVTPGASVSYSIGGAGGDTWFSSNTTLLAKGGSQGGSGSDGVGGAGGSAGASIGTIKASGGSGANGSSGSFTGGGGGSSAGSTNGSSATGGSSGVNAGGGAAPVAPSGTNSGAGGTGGNNNNNYTGQAGQAPGGGGGGIAGNNGASGQIRVTYSTFGAYTVIDTIDATPTQNSGKQIQISGYLTFNVDSSSTGKDGVGYAYGKWQYRVSGSGSSWTDAGTEVACTTPCSWDSTKNSGTDGSITVSHLLPMLTVGTAYQFRVLLRVDTTSSTLSAPFKSTSGNTGSVQS